MEIIIGRDAETSQLRITVGSQSRLFGTLGSVPASVSRQHCSLTRNSDGTFTMKNLKAQNITLVNGLAVEQKNVSERDTLELGNDHYPLDWGFIGQIMPRMADIRPLQQVWEQYQTDLLALTVKQNRFNALRAGTGILTMVAIAAGFIIGKEESSTLYVVLYSVAILLSLGFFVKSYIDAGKVPVERQRLSERFQHDYVCPCCGRFLSQPYDQVRLLDQCPYCKAQFRK